MSVSFDRLTGVAAPLRVARGRAGDASVQALLRDPALLGVITLGASREAASGAPTGALPAIDRDVPRAFVDTPPAFAAAPTLEAWCGQGDIRTGREHDAHWASDADTAFVSLALDVAPRFDASVEHAYRSLFAALDALDRPHLWRIWNFIPHIHDHDPHTGLERYRAFNVARHRAFEAASRSAFEGAPAASALGTRDGPLVVHAIASRTPSVPIENPRQTSAYRYPAEHGPRAPSFSRAALVPGARDDGLFVSGTASIVGHASVHVGDVRAQTIETLANLEVVIAQANARSAHRRFTLDACALRVYVREAAHAPIVREVLHARLGPSIDVVVLIADVCRRELLVEIEACA